MSNVLEAEEAIDKLKLKNSKNHFSNSLILAKLQLTAKQAYETTFETTCKTSCAVTSRLLTRGHYLVKNISLLLQWNLNTCLRVKFEGVG